MDNVAKVFKFDKPIIIYEDRVLDEIEHISNQTINSVPVVNNSISNTTNLSKVIDDIASTIENDDDNFDFSNNEPNYKTYDKPIIVNEPIVENVPSAYSDTERSVSELTQEIKLDLEANAEEATRQFLSSSEITSLSNNSSTIVVEKKKIDSLPFDDTIVKKYHELYGPDEQGLLNLTFNDGNKYITVIDYLESERVLDYIPFDSTVIFSNDKFNGKDFIKNIMIPYLMKNGYHTLNDTMEILDAKVNKVEEKKSIFSIFSRH